ncbi:MAG: aminomethyl-transferring glycine dehydrogenase [Propionibacteriaceae bacterium]|nr:aminomethyl-transferring glycine dehydrogenase [Propionibacteriaceae bacterium]
MVNDVSAFASRHIGPSPHDQAAMLACLGYGDLDALVAAAMPEEVRWNDTLNLPEACDEAAHLARMRALAAKNNPLRAMIGLGYHGTVTPAVIRRNVLEDPSWYTAYTPYQPEISQGRLEALLNFQTMVADLTGLPVAGASLLDEATAVAEAVRVARRQVRSGRGVIVDAGILPQSLAVLRTHCSTLDASVTETADVLASIAHHDPFAVVVQNPRTDGQVWAAEDLARVVAAAHAKGALVIAACDLLSLTLMVPPGEWGADIAVGTTQRFGVPLFYGGPHAGYIAVRKGLERGLPGRLVGVSRDADGNPAYRLALQTREQHIRREKATSNICTAQVLLAVVAAMYAVYHGPHGLKRIAASVHQRARELAGALRQGGYQLAGERFFDTLTVRAVGRAHEIVAAARAAGVHLRLVDADHVGVSIGEDATPDDLAAVRSAFGVREAAPLGGYGPERTSAYLTHQVFSAHHSETELVRYLRGLKDRDFALDKGMIPLGSCTMKLNSAAEMEPVSYPGFADLHPFVPAEDAVGYLELIGELETWLAEITGYDAVSLQPNAGSQGEYAGLMAIRSYHLANNQPERVVCLIPASAHGTNAASAVMAGMKVVVVATAAGGSIDQADFAAKLAEHADRLAAVMLTYPSTHGVFEDGVAGLCESVHRVGGQVYIDGANMNALVGLSKPRAFGGDVSHVNLHKTFAIPHGGGGPGVGPIGVRAHLAPFLPNHPVVTAGPETSYGPVSAAPYGSPGVLAISYGYIAMMGAQGLRRGTQAALLGANYIAARLRQHYPVLYTGASGLVAHECILDLRPLTKQTKVTVDDVAKRLIDYGFHAPTLSFPVAGTLMVEPTESEPKAELDRFCDAMIAIRAEIDAVGRGDWPAGDNPLAGAPHPLGRVLGEWDHPYSRNVAAFGTDHPTPEQTRGKFWPSVGRIDGAYGDRNLVCSCPPPEAFENR